MTDNNLESALMVEAIVNALDIPDPFKAPFQVPRIKVSGEWIPGAISTEAFTAGTIPTT